MTVDPSRLLITVAPTGAETRKDDCPQLPTTLPELVETAAANLEPHHLPHYAQDIAAVFHSFYKQCRVVSEDEALTRARLKLVSACKLVLGNTMALIGVSAPEQM